MERVKTREKEGRESMNEREREWKGKEEGYRNINEEWEVKERKLKREIRQMEE